MATAYATRSTRASRENSKMRGTAVESISKNINVGLVTNFGGDMGERLETENIMTSKSAVDKTVW